MGSHQPLADPLVIINALHVSIEASLSLSQEPPTGYRQTLRASYTIDMPLRSGP